VAYLLDADPVAARARKPEYPTAFLHQCRRAYFLLACILGTMTIVRQMSLVDAKREVENAMARALATDRSEIAVSLDTASASESR
jgi:hypothetical protein